MKSKREFKISKSKKYKKKEKKPKTDGSIEQDVKLVNDVIKKSTYVKEAQLDLIHSQRKRIEFSKSMELVFLEMREIELKDEIKKFKDKQIEWELKIKNDRLEEK